MLTFMLTCVTCTSHLTSLGLGGDIHVNLRHMYISPYVTGFGGGDVNVHVNLRHMHISPYVTGLEGSGDVNVHVNLRHMHISRYVTWLGVGMLTFMLTCATCISNVTSLGWGWGC